MAFVALSAAATVYAQEEYRQYEITPFFGTRFGGNIDLSQQGNPNVDYLKIKNSMDYGIMGSVTLLAEFPGRIHVESPTHLSQRSQSQ